MSLRRASAAAASVVLVGTLATVPASTALAATTAACTMTVGSITSGGDIGYSNVTASAPITARQGTGVHIFTPGIAKLSTTWTWEDQTNGYTLTAGEVLLNNTLYSAYYGTDPDGKPVTGLSRVETGYGNYIVDESAEWPAGTRVAAYRLRNDGVLYRSEYHWFGNPYTTVTRFTGFAAVKTMALISETATYDSFLAITRGGALYTIRFPRAAGAKPVVKQVRTSTWQVFENLVAERCGVQSTLLTGIDKDTGNAYLYAVGHANGASTVIKGLGKIPGTYKDPVYYLRTTEAIPPLFGE